MGLTLSQRRAITEELAQRYQRAGKKERGEMLDQITALCGYDRSYAAFVLRNWGRKKTLMLGGKSVVVIFGREKKHAPLKRPRTYDERVTPVLERLWKISDGLCGKRLAPFIRDTLPILERFEEITLDAPTRQKLLTISPATIDRLLVKVKASALLKGRSMTKPGTLLKHQIPIRTFADWNEQTPGFVEIDLVQHDGGHTKGDFCQTLDVTDICTGWTETRAVKNKAQRWVFEALQDVIAHLPFAIRGIDSDNGSEFINNHLCRFCEANTITFTRSRPLRKNDNCFVEQKNYSVVRKAVGYYRYDTPQELALLQQLYGHLRLFSNFFQPVMKLREKTRVGSKVTKKYDKPQTPYHRVMNHPDVPDEKKHKLHASYERLNPADLKRKIIKLQNTLFAITERKSHPMRSSQNEKSEYITP